jgi:hypothetical protein
MDGSVRSVVRASARIRVLDAGASGLLIDRSQESARAWLVDTRTGTPRRDLTWLGHSVVDAMSDDGQRVLLTVRIGPTLQGRLGGELYPIYVRPSDGTAATFLGNGFGEALSPDGKWALTMTRAGAASQFVVLPLGVGSAKTLDRDGLNVQGSLTPSFAGGDRIVFDAGRGTEAPRTYVQAIGGGKPTLVDHEPGRIVSPVAPDGEHFISQREDGTLWLARLTEGSATPLPFALPPGQYIRQWTEDGGDVFILTLRQEGWQVTATNIRTGQRRQPFVIPRDPQSGPNFRASLRVSRDGGTIAYTDGRIKSDLFVVDGVR